MQPKQTKSGVCEWLLKQTVVVDVASLTIYLSQSQEKRITELHICQLYSPGQ